MTPLHVKFRIFLRHGGFSMLVHKGRLRTCIAKADASFTMGLRKRYRRQACIAMCEV